MPSLLTNCGTWTQITEKEENMFDEIQNMFCRAVLQIQVSSPKPSLRAVFGLPGMKWRVMEAKVLLVLAVRISPVMTVEEPGYNSRRGENKLTSFLFVYPKY